MRSIKTIFSTTNYRFLVAITCSILLAGLLPGTIPNATAQEASGYISPNKSDLPPDLTHDVDLQSTNTNGPPAYGPADAKVLVVTFADFGCPACRRASQATHQIAREFPGEVRIEFWNNPLAIHRNADLAAVAGIAAQRQGHFWEMHDLMFQNGNHELATLEKHAEVLGLDMAKFRSDMNDPAVKQRIKEESELAQALGARATPGFLINGKLNMGWGSWKGFRNMVQRELHASEKLAQEGISPVEIQNQRALDNNTDSESYQLYLSRILAPNFDSESE